MTGDVDALIFDLDGTLYEDDRVYDRFAEELAHFLPADKGDSLLDDWQRAKKGYGPARVGMGYDLGRDLLFRYQGRRITTYLDWEGIEREAPEITSWRMDARPDDPPVEVPLFGQDRLNIGDWWGLPDILAAHHGVAREDRQAAFHATRRAMETSLRLEPDDWLDGMLRHLAKKKRLIALSNSPAETVEDVFNQLGVKEHFSLIAPSSAKPAGMTDFLAEQTRPEQVLSIGDNFVNDIEPALRAGAWALYIDRHATGLGRDCERCLCVSNRIEMRDRLLGHLY